MTASDTLLDRRQVVARLLADRGELLVVSGLGSPSWDVAAAGDCDANFYLWGGMGGAAVAGLGLAIAQPQRRVLVITGDGEMLMGLGSLATIGAARPANLAIAVLDNERYGETGMQRSHTAAGVDLAAVAAAAGFPTVMSASRGDDLAAAIDALRGGPGPVFAVFKIRPEKAPLVLPPRDGAYLVRRFRLALLGPQSAFE